MAKELSKLNFEFSFPRNSGNEPHILALVEKIKAVVNVSEATNTVFMKNYKYSKLNLVNKLLQ